LLPPDFHTWQERFNARYDGVVDQHEFEVRLQTACREIEHVLATDYYTIIVNDDLDDTVAQVRAVAKGDKQTDAKRQQSLQAARQLLADLVAPSTR
jgi:guanylate kinase